MFQVYSEFIKNLVIIITQVYFERVFEMHLYFFSGSDILEADFLNLQIYIQS